MLCKHTRWFGLFLEEGLDFGTSLSLPCWKNLIPKLISNEKEINDFCQCLSRVSISLLAAGLAAEETELEICSLNHQGSVGDCSALQHSLSSLGLDFSLHNSDTLRKKLNVAKQTWIWSIPVAGVCSSVPPSST